MRKQTPEGALLKLCMDYLAARRILAFRMNTGTLKDRTGRPVSYGVPGMADILAFRQRLREVSGNAYDEVTPFWLELKAGTNTQSDLQKSFEEQVKAVGCRYHVIYSLEDLENALR